MTESVIITGKKYTVDREMPKNGDAIGLFQGQLQQIHIHRDSPPDEANETLLHECIHGIDWNYAIGLKEKQVRRLSNALFAFMRDNKEFILEILKEKK